MKRKDIFAIIQKCCTEISVSKDNDCLSFAINHPMKPEIGREFADSFISLIQETGLNENVNFGQFSAVLIPSHQTENFRKPIATRLNLRIFDNRPAPPRLPKSEAEMATSLRGAKLILFLLGKEMEKDAARLPEKVIDHGSNKIFGNAKAKREPTPQQG